MPTTRICEGCGKPHECQETFREMVERCAQERDGSVIIHSSVEADVDALVGKLA